MTRQEIIKDYKVKSGVILSPGKFEGEMLYAPYFYALLLLGEGEFDADTGDTSFDITKEDIEEFPELKGCDIVYLSEDEDGFVYCKASEISK